MAVFLGGLILIGIEPGIGMMERHLDLTFMIVWSLALANVIGAGTCLFLAKPIARITLVPFAILAPFMIVIIYFAAFQSTRAWPDLITLFVLGVIAMYMKRFGWSRPAFLIGFVLANRLDASVYQSIQTYGMSFLERGGVQILLGLIVLSIFVAARMTPHRGPLTPDGVHAPIDRGPQTAFLVFLIGCVLYAIYDLQDLAFLGKVFPMSVSIIALVLLAAVGFVFARGKPDYALEDAERELTGADKPQVSELRVQSWILWLLVAIALVGYILGTFIYISLFLRLKAGVRWHWAMVGALGMVAVLAAFGHFLVLQYPEGLLQHYFELPWPLD